MQFCMITHTHTHTHSLQGFGLLPLSEAHFIQQYPRNYIYALFTSLIHTCTWSKHSSIRASTQN